MNFLSSLFEFILFYFCNQSARGYWSVFMLIGLGGGKVSYVTAGTVRKDWGLGLKMI